MTDPFWLDPAELRVFRAMNRSWTAVLARLDADLERQTGLPRTYFDVLWRLRRAPERALRMADLAAQTESKASRMTHAIGRLADDGLVRREPVPGDRRGWRAVLTDAGLAAVERAAPVYARSIRTHFLDQLDPVMREHLVTIGETLLSTLDPERLSRPGEPAPL